MRRISIVLFVLLGVTTAVAAGGPDEAGIAGPAVAQTRVVAQPPEGFSSVTAAGVTFSWKVDGELLRVEMRAETTGWIAVGFDPSRQMADANIIIGFVKDDEVFLRDDFGIGAVRHGADVDNGGVDNLSDVSGSEADGVTTISFSIPIDSGDPTDTVLTPGATHTVIVAAGPDRADDYGSYHSSRGSVRVEL